MRNLVELDIVRVIHVRSDQTCEATVGCGRRPRVGDVATICHDYSPGDSESVVAVEMIDAQGMTIWLADFKKKDLAFVERPSQHAEQSQGWRSL